MVSSRRAIACILLSLGVAVCAYAQSATKEQTGSISGKVTLKNKGVAGVVVVAIQNNYTGNSERPRHRATTDHDGNYRINDIPAGSYSAYPLTPALAPDKAEAKRLLTIAAGESIRDVDFAMVRGGVVTGRITSAEGQPLIAESVSVVPVDIQPNQLHHNFSVQTDDRGIYRAFGLRAGKYRVFVGHSASGLPAHIRQTTRQTFYPSVTEIDKATVIEVTEGSEAIDINIVAATPHPTFSVSGRIMDSAGKPVAGGNLGIQQTDGEGTISSTGGAITNSNGEFKLENVLPGKYLLFFAPPQNSDLRADPINFEVIDSDLTGLEFKTKKGASLSGMVVVEGSYDKSLAALFKGVQVFVSFDTPSSDYESGSRSVEIGADGSFRIAGVGAGNAGLNFVYSHDSDVRQFEIMHLERNGAIQSSGISIKEGEQVDGVRMVVKYRKLTGSIRGIVNIENGELPPGARLRVWVRLADPSTTNMHAPQVDSRGHFLLERLAPGTYDVRATVFEPGATRGSHNSPKQVITVTDNVVSDVTLTIKLKS